MLDLRDREACARAVDGTRSIYNLACHMGGVGFIEDNRATCMLNVLINTHLLEAARTQPIDAFFYASSACVYPASRQDDPGRGQTSDRVGTLDQLEGGARAHVRLDP